MRISKKILTGALLTGLAGPVVAVPVLQVGPDSGGTYDGTTETWVFDDDGGSFSFNVYSTGETGWEAYIVLAAVPKTGDDVFDVTVSDDSGSLSLYDSGYGTPPFDDPNSLAPHDIYATYSEIYVITFDGVDGVIPNTQPGDDGTGYGRVETVTVSWDALGLDPELTGIHIDLYTADYDAEKDKDIVTAFAPFSHDGEFVVPVPAAVWLFGSGLLGMVAVARRRA